MSLQAVIDHYSSIPGNEAGGSLHIVLDDGNDTHSSVLFCLGRSLERKDYLGAYISQELLKIPEDKLGDALLVGVDFFTDK